MLAFSILGEERGTKEKQNTYHLLEIQKYQDKQREDMIVFRSLVGFGLRNWESITRWPLLLIIKIRQFVSLV